MMFIVFLFLAAVFGLFSIGLGSVAVLLILVVLAYYVFYVPIRRDRTQPGKFDW